MVKYAVMDNEGADKWLGHEEVSMRRLTQPGSTWDVYRCHMDELPDIDTVDQYTGIFVTGSHCSANESQPWIHKELEWLCAFAQRQSPCKLVASCFGCQLLASSLGGIVGQNPSGEFVLTVETVRITDALLQQPYHQEVAAQHQIAETFRIIKSHGEQILALPKCAVLLGTSPSAPFEFWSFGCNILALQGHCEFDCETTLKKIHAPLTASKRLSPEQSELSAQALLNIRPDDAFVTDLIKHWWRQPAPTTPVDQQPSGHPSSKLPSALNVQGGPPNSVSMAEGHFQFGQSLAPFVAGHPQTSGIDTPTDKLLGDAGQGPPTGARTHSTPILHQGLSNPSPIVPGAAPERTNCSVQDDTATAAAAAADQHADVAEPPPEQSASSLLPERASTRSWQQPCCFCTPCARCGQSGTRGTQTQSDRDAAGDEDEGGAGLKGWVEEGRQHEEQLTQKAQVLMNELAAVVVAETASSCLDYILLKDMNQLAQTQYADMANFVKGLQPQMEDLLVCQEAAEPVLEAIAKLEQNLAVIESAVSQLEHESKQVMQQLGLAKDGS
ncbi:hypothetical protein WJX77_004578 [Trebouxia sp. C0004]